MKKAITILMTLVMVFLCCASVPAMAASTPTFVWEDCALQILGYKAFYFQEDNDASIHLYARLINNKDYKLFVWLTDAMINGVSVEGGIMSCEPHSDTGTEDPESFRIGVLDSNRDEGVKAINSTGTLEATLQFKNATTKEIVCSQKISIELNALEGTRVTPKPKAEATPKPEVGNKKYAPAYTPTSTEYTGLKEGSNGQAVLDLQKRLKDLGYYSDKTDGFFEESTIIAVRAFCSQHNLKVQNVVTPEMQELLYSNRAEYFEEPYVPLVIGPKYSTREPLKAESNVGTVSPEVVNLSKDRTIRGYELKFYQTNVWGEKIENSEGGYYGLYPCTQKIEPGQLATHTGLKISEWAYTYSVYVGISRIVFYDGEIREVPDDEIVYYNLRINE